MNTLLLYESRFKVMADASSEWGEGGGGNVKNLQISHGGNIALTNRLLNKARKRHG